MVAGSIGMLMLTLPGRRRRYLSAAIDCLGVTMTQSSGLHWPESASESMEQSLAVVEPSASSPAQQLQVVQSPNPTEHAGRSPGNPLHAVPRFPATRGPA